MSWSTVESVAIVGGRKTEDMPVEAFRALAARYPEVVVDLGTGDGRYVLRTARTRPDSLVIGIDPVAEAMAASATRAARKPARGGMENALFMVASLERLPDVLRSTAGELTVNYPWGSLLRAVGWPRPDELRTVVELLAPGARVLALLNASAAERERHAERLELPPLEDPAHVEDQLLPGWERAGLEAIEWRYYNAGEDPPIHSTWGQRLVRGSRRATLCVSGRRSSASTAS